MATIEDLQSFTRDVYTALDELESAVEKVREELSYVRNGLDEIESDEAEGDRATILGELAEDFDPEAVREFDADLADLIRRARRALRNA